MIGLLEQIAAERVLLHRGDRDHDRDLVLPAVDHLRHGVGQADIGDDDDAGLARGAGIAVGHGDDGAFVDALDQLDRGLVDERVEDRIVAGRWIEEDMLDARGLELLHEQRAAGTLHLAHGGGGRGGRALPEGLERLRHRLGGDGAHAERAQAGHELPARHAVVEILLDEILHGVLLPVLAVDQAGRGVGRPPPLLGPPNASTVTGRAKGSKWLYLPSRALDWSECRVVTQQAVSS